MRPFLWSFIVFLALAPTAALAQKTVLVKAQSLSLREKPLKNGTVLGKLTTFQPVELIKKDGDWAQVRDLQKRTGFVLADYLTDKAFVYTGPDKVSGRRGPGTQYEVWIEYTQPNIPLRVCDATADGWVMIMDYEGDRSWVPAKGLQTAGTYVITKVDDCKVRKGVGIGQDLLFTAQKGVIFKAIEEKDGWLHVKYTDGDEGWISLKLIYGWNDVAAPEVKSSKPAVPTPTPTPKGKATTKKTTTKTKATTKKKAASSDDSSADPPAKTTSKTAAKKKAAASSDDAPADTSADAPAKTTATKKTVRKTPTPSDASTSE